MQLSEMEYKGLNLLDEVCSVEIALDEVLDVVHIYDTNYVVEPTYNFKQKNYELSEGFFQLAEVLKQKYFFVEKRKSNMNEWMSSLTWQFYSSNKSVKCFDGQDITVMGIADLLQKSEQALIEAKLYPKYVYRLAEHV
ncbi:aminopeptidase [Lysinibacillus sp. KU-BSD001]|uniref:aminopeptidase n=1 Tax=Lysinibacillus sp. KU-BSD001 TaxID=3141328 RepID=UPI0036F11B31